MDNVIFNNPDPFNDSDDNEIRVDIRIQQRTTRTYVTIVEGLDGIENLNFEKIMKYMKKMFSCGATVIETDDKKIIKLQGDQRQNVKKFLSDEAIVALNQIHVHGY